jgi:peptide/nickel transport system permease protein
VLNRLQYIAGRLLKGVVVLFFIIVVNFVLIRMAPGDPVSVMAGESGNADEVFMQQVRHEFGLDKSIPEQLWAYVKHIVVLDFGQSYRQQRPIRDILLERVKATLLLTLTAYLIALVPGVILGIFSAKYAGRAGDYLITTMSLLFYAMPLFWVALMAILVFSVWLDWLPAYGITNLDRPSTGLAWVADVAHHLILPAMTLGLFYMAVYARMARTTVREALQNDYVRTARAKGVGEGRILRAHVLRNALLPIITLAGLNAGHLVGGSVVIETVFAWPGIGHLAFEAVLQRDYNMLLGVFFLTSAMVIFFNILTDLAYSIVDPRIQLGS